MLLVLLVAPTARAQNDQAPKYNVKVNVVPLDVEVLDRSGSPVTNLTRNDFVVKENGKTVTISNFARLQDKSVSLTIVLDTSSISLEKLDRAKEAISQLMHLLGPEDDICLYTFDTKDARLEQDFTKDRLLLINALENISVPSGGSGGLLIGLLGPSPKTALAIDLALLNLARSNNGKKALLVVSNQFRGLGPATVEHVQNSGCTLLTLGFSNKAAPLFSLGGDQISRRQLMRESGGRRFSADTEDIAGVCRSIAFSLKNYYALAYLTKAPAEEVKSRRIEVLVPGHDCVIHARRTYIPKTEG